MDGQHFDRLTQQLAQALSRRRFGAVLAGLGLGVGLGAESLAKPKKKKKKKKSKGCPNGAVTCGGACVDTQTNAAHCGGCGGACPSGQSCAGGVCQAGGCLGDRELCGTACVNLDNDEQNCGECGRSCAGDLTCLSGECGCATGTRCGNDCVNVNDDNAHCGQCDRGCTGDLTCSNGTCGCASGTTCGDACVNTQTDRRHCGGCGAACAAGQNCSGGACVAAPECTNRDQCGGSRFNDLVCRNGRCVCEAADQGICRRFPDGRGQCHLCCPGGSEQCPGGRGEVCFYDGVSGLCTCPTGWDRCEGSGECVFDSDTDSRRCGRFCRDCEARLETNPKGICCGGECITGCGIDSNCGGAQFGPCGPNCQPCGSDAICCNMGPGTLPRCIPNTRGGFCYLN